MGALGTLMAAHALSQQAQLITNNTRDFSNVPGLQLENQANATEVFRLLPIEAVCHLPE